MKSTTYFVAYSGIEIANNLSREKAIEIAKKEYDKGNTTVGVGRVRYSNREKKYVYTFLPLQFYVD